MNATKKPTCIVGIAVSKRNLGVCVLEQPDFLLDWGVKKMIDRKPETIAKLLAFVFEFYRPVKIYLQDVEHSDCKLSKENIEVIREIQRIAKRKEVHVRTSSCIDVKLHLGLTNKDNMNHVAQKIAEQFPVLSKRLPPKRRPWEGEHRAMVLFMALAIRCRHI